MSLENIKKIEAVYKMFERIPGTFRLLVIFISVLSVLAVTVLPLTKGSITSAAETSSVAGTASAIQDAIDDLHGAPGTIYLKAGKFNLGGIVTLHEGVEIIGAGADYTTINTTGDHQWLFIPDGADNCRISGIKFDYPAEGKGQAIYIAGDYFATVLDFRIDNCEFYGYGYYESAIKIRGDVRGVIDHNYFENTRDTWSEGYGYGVMYDGDNKYTTDTSKYLGTAENLFVEDNEFRYCRHSIAANRGAHYVFRYNWCHDGILGQQVDAHGGFSDYNCGTILADVYNNVIEDYTSGFDRGMKFRGGQFIVHDNVVSDYKHFIMLQLDNGTTFDIALLCKIHDSYEWSNRGVTDVYVEDGTWPSTKYIREGIEYFTDTPHPTYKPYIYPHPLTQEDGVTPNNLPVWTDQMATVEEDSNGTISWATKTVEISANSGYYTSLAFDSAGNPSISYYDQTKGDLKYTSWNGTGWNTETVDSDGAIGLYTSLAFDGAGNPSISYYDQTKADLKYTSWNGASWDTETLDSDGTVGLFTSLAFDGTGNPAISYYDLTNGDLKYTSWNGASWDTKTVDNEGYVGLYTSLAFDGAGNPAISYWDLTKGDLKYSCWNGAAWDTETVDSDGIVGLNTSLAFDGAGNPAISYNGFTMGDVRYTIWTGTSWDTETLNSQGIVQYSSLAFDGAGNPAVSYFDITNNKLEYAYTILG